MTLLNHDLLNALSSTRGAPCLSLYQPTHRRHPENEQDPIRFGELVKALREALLQSYPDVDPRPILEPFRALAQRSDFWEHTLDGLAVLGSPGLFRVIPVPHSVAELVVVSDHFYLMPLRRFMQSVDRYHVLALTLNEAKLFVGNRHALDEVELAPGFPRTSADALGSELSEPHRTVASYGGVGAASMAMHHGHGGRREEAAIDSEKFFRAVDRAVQDRHSRPTGLPLILAALPEHHHLFHEVSRNPQLIAEGIRCDPDSLAADELRALAWKAIEPQYQATLAALADEYRNAQSRGLASDDVAEVAQAAAFERVATLLVEADRHIPGRLEGRNGRVEIAEPGDEQPADLLDDLGDLVERLGGRVVVVPSERMPSRTGLAATYRH